MPLGQANASTVSQIYVSDKLHNLSANQTRDIVAYRREPSEMAEVWSKEFAVHVCGFPALNIRAGRDKWTDWDL